MLVIFVYNLARSMQKIKTIKEEKKIKEEEERKQNHKAKRRIYISIYFLSFNLQELFQKEEKGQTRKGPAQNFSIPQREAQV